MQNEQSRPGSGGSDYPLNVGENLRQMFSLEGKVALITGAGGGIGSELALGLAKAGASVAIADINTQTLEDTRASIEGAGGIAAAFAVDLRSLQDIRRLVQDVVGKFGRIDILVNNAGVNKREPFTVPDEETFDFIVDINLKAVYFLSHAVAKHMVEAGIVGGSIINIGSHTAAAAMGGNTIYGATKSGVVSITRSIAIEMAPYGIRANAISPGHIMTPLTEKSLWADEGRSKWLLDRIAMQRPGYPKDLVGLAVLLASDASAYMSGMSYHVDGGCLAGGVPWEL